MNNSLKKIITVLGLTFIIQSCGQAKSDQALNSFESLSTNIVGFNGALACDANQETCESYVLEVSGQCLSCVSSGVYIELGQEAYSIQTNDKGYFSFQSQLTSLSESFFIASMDMLSSDGLIEGSLYALKSPTSSNLNGTLSSPKRTKLPINIRFNEGGGGGNN